MGFIKHKIIIIIIIIKKFLELSSQKDLMGEVYILL